MATQELFNYSTFRMSKSLLAMKVLPGGVEYVVTSMLASRRYFCLLLGRFHAGLVSIFSIIAQSSRGLQVSSLLSSSTRLWHNNMSSIAYSISAAAVATKFEPYRGPLSRCLKNLTNVVSIYLKRGK
jgi:hypothetical protein